MFKDTDFVILGMGWNHFERTTRWQYVGKLSQCRNIFISRRGGTVGASGLPGKDAFCRNPIYYPVWSNVSSYRKKLETVGIEIKTCEQ